MISHCAFLPAVALASMYEALEAYNLTVMRQRSQEVVDVALYMA
jgi:hypothetical protein